MTNLASEFNRVEAFVRHDTTLTEWIQFGVVLVIGMVVIWGINRFGIRRFVHRLERHRITVAKAVGSAMAAPINVVTLVFFLNTAKSVFRNFPDWLEQRLDHLVAVIYYLTIVVILFRLIDIGLVGLKKRWVTAGTDLDEQMARFLEKIAKIFVLMIGFIIVLDQMGVKVLGLITGLGFLGAAMALAAQSTLANFIGSIEILADRLFKVGDRVAFENYDGFVTKMGLRSVELTSLYGEKINLPNKDLVDKQIRNYTRGKFVRTATKVGITYDNARQGIEKAMAVLDEAIRRVKEDPNLPEIDRWEVVFREFGESSIDLELIYWAYYRNTAELNPLINRLNLEIKELLDAAGISIAFPSRTIYLQNQLLKETDKDKT